MLCTLVSYMYMYTTSCLKNTNESLSLEHDDLYHQSHYHHRRHQHEQQKKTLTSSLKHRCHHHHHHSLPIYYFCLQWPLSTDVSSVFFIRHHCHAAPHWSSSLPKKIYILVIAASAAYCSAAVTSISIMVIGKIRF